MDLPGAQPTWQPQHLMTSQEAALAGFTSITNVWDNVKEIDLRPLRQDALRIVKIAIVGAPDTGRNRLASQMSSDPRRPEDITLQANIPILDLDKAEQIEDTHLVILMLDARQVDVASQKELARQWAEAEKPVLVFVNNIEKGDRYSFGAWTDWSQRRVVFGDVNDTEFLLDGFAKAVMDLMPGRLTALGRQYPLFRTPIAQALINDTSFTNAAYSVSTGLAEIIPIFNVPLNVADMLVLTKAQAFLVYKLGLTLGLSLDWQDYVTEFGGVLGSGFLWRQLARSLIGLIPAWGIIPKVAVAYAGTYVVGRVVVQWYLTGRHVTRKQMNEFYQQAFARGKHVARNLASKFPRPKLRKRKPAALPAPKATLSCPNCGQESAVDARYCQYCGHPLEPMSSPTG
jgi:uncharacterized protein (DUF697 family)